ncbi:MAG: hypothetical protein JXR22_12660 [Prolixibacteraceae bacterium]|nr:hypothetical protein [Prolixibacteraceae bacterium]
MKRKWPLFAGIVLLLSGILLGALSAVEILPKVVIYAGVAFKVFYVVQEMLAGRYKPGYEISLLALGLVLFLSGMYLKKTGADFPYLTLMVPGILLKVSFILVFILKARKQGNTA